MLTPHQISALQGVHADMSGDMRHAHGEYPLTVERLYEQMTKALSIIGGFCDACSGDGRDYREGICGSCAGTGQS